MQRFTENQVAHFRLDTWFAFQLTEQDITEAHNVCKRSPLSVHFMQKEGRTRVKFYGPRPPKPVRDRVKQYLEHLKNRPRVIEKN